MQSDAPSKLVITNVRLANPDLARSNDFWRIECSGGRVSGVHCLTGEDPHLKRVDIDAKGGLILPSLCHSHIHLDKCFILDRCQLVTGDFAEALQVTNKAKASFDRDDLYKRGYRLISESLECGVTSMRAHVEIDTAVEFLCLEVGQKLRKDFSALCDIQVAAFAQEPLFDTSGSTEPGRNYSLLVELTARTSNSITERAGLFETHRLWGRRK
ncbi:hypothetical protein K438DRAFT_294214 [Mycena galopus ATCC 62051]|nr:hypothetical protein K438DRAFT_294214 [Mycena galopus ATCC 62051]